MKTKLKLWKHSPRRNFVSAILRVVLLLVGNLPGFAQGFANLDFEDSVIVSSQPTSYGFNIGTANVPGWTEYYGWGDANYSGGATLAYNAQTLDAAGVSLQDTASWTPAILGNYSILLQGGTIYAAQAYPGMTNGAAIGQTGQIPPNAKSISYWVSNGGVQVSFNGQAIPFTEVNNTGSYSVWVADISTYAGQTGQLLFAVPYPNGEAMIDNIQFSSSSVPEPSEFALTALGALLLSFRRLQNSFIRR